MPVTKTAKRALRGSVKKQEVNSVLKTSLDIAERKARSTTSKDNVSKVFSLADRAVKKHMIHKNKANRIKATFSKLLASKKK